MSRWLLVCADRSNRQEMDLTQEFLSVMLGVRRQSVNVTAGLLQRAGLIEYRRGGVRIVDREGLEATACECYRAGTRLYDHNMSL
jgi:Mn-dependent DtxR family transcriptional regulator